MQKILVTIIFLGVIFIILVTLSEDSLPTTSIYNIKRLKENIVLILKPSPEDKAKYYSELLDLRLNELSLLTAKKKQHHLILPSALRYSTTAGEYTQLLREKNLKNYSEKTREKFKKHSEILMKLYTTYPRENVGDGGDQFIKDSINYLIIYEKELP